MDKILSKSCILSQDFFFFKMFNKFNKAFINTHITIIRINAKTIFYSVKKKGLLFQYFIGVGSFSILGGPNPARPTSILEGGYCQKYIFACVHMYMYAHTCIKYSYTHACIHRHVCMHAQSMQTYILDIDIDIEDLFYVEYTYNK